MPTLHIHLGVHKTASTFLQDCIALHRRELAFSGINWLGPAEIRDIVVRAVNLQSKQTNRQVHQLDYLRKKASLLFSEVKHANTVVLSDENLLGGCRKAFCEAGFYPNLTQRMRALGSLLPIKATKIFLAVRSPETFATSAYCESLLHAKQFINFSSYFAEARTSTLLWSELVYRLRQSFQDAQIVVWKYEEFALVAEQILELLLGKEGAKMVLPLPISERNRPSLSALAVDLLEQTSGTVTPVDYKKLVGGMRKLFPKSQQYLGLQPKELKHTNWRKHYANDIECLSSLEGVTVLKAN